MFQAPSTVSDLTLLETSPTVGNMAEKFSNVACSPENTVKENMA